MSDDNYCDKHDVDIDDVAAYDNCPYCEMRREQEAMAQERAMRHAPRSVDDPASIDAYRG